MYERQRRIEEKLEASLQQQIKELQESMSDLPARVAGIEHDMNELKAAVVTEAEADAEDGNAQSTEIPTGGFSLWGKSDVNKKLVEFSSVTLVESTWEVGIFVWLDAIGIAGSVWITLIILLNIFVQLLFAGIISVYLTEKTQYVTSGWKWREATGHDYRHATDDGSSLVRRLCNDEERGSLFLSGKQVEVVAPIIEYLGKENHGRLVDFGPGPILCILALMFWFLTQWTEIQRIVDTTHAVCRLSRTSSTELLCTESGFKLTGINIRRRIGFLVITLARGCVATLLTLAGTVWLINTIDVENIILNMVALTCVLEVDEIIYATLCPKYARLILLSLEPLPKTMGRTWEGLDVRPLLTSLALVCFMFIAYYSVLEDVIEQSRSTYDALCGGEQHFVVATNAATGVVGSFYSHEATDTKQLSEHLIRDMVARSPKNVTVRFGTYAELLVFENHDAMSIGRSLGHCEPDKVVPSLALQVGIRHHFNNASWGSCTDLNLSMCIDGPAVLRVACPYQCGCSDPMAGSWRYDGCPQRQCVTTTAYKKKQMSMAAQDLEIEALNVSPEWHSYLKSMLTFSKASHLGTIAKNEALNRLIVDSHSTFKAHGCKALEIISSTKTVTMARMKGAFCSDQADTIFRRPLAVFCPVTCECGVEAATYPPAEHFCPKNSTLTLPTSKWGIPCGHLAIVSTEFPANTSCSGDFKTSSPKGMYTCTPDYNGKNVYRRTNGGVTWEIKWEKSRELGGVIIGNLNGSGSQAKWTFSSISASSRPLGDRHFYSMDNTVPVPRNKWLPVTDQNTNLTGGGHHKCDILGPEPNVGIKIYTGKWYLTSWRRESCAKTCLKAGRTCNIIMFSHMLELNRHNMEQVVRSISSAAETTCTGTIPICSFPTYLGEGKRSICQDIPPLKYFRRICWCSEQLQD
jgi:hypothetical protein